MRYRETRERSAELLRLVVPEMCRHPAPLYPQHYGIWYEHLAGINPTLSAALEAMQSSGHRLTSEDVNSLHLAHIATRESQSAQRLHQDLATLIDQLAAITNTTTEGAMAYRSSLAECAARLRGDPSVDSIGAVVQVLMQQTEAVQSSTDKLVADLDHVRAEMKTLRGEVDTLREAAVTDRLTGLKNRRGFEFAVEKLTEEGGLAGCSLFICDIDYFKNINDTYGHLVGDRVLSALGRLLRLHVKGRDAVARWGGEEFAVILPQTHAEDARSLAEQIRSDISRGRIKRLDRDECIASVTISIGIAEGTVQDTLNTLVERADRAMYEAKKGGRNQVVIALPPKHKAPCLSAVP